MRTKWPCLFEVGDAALQSCGRSCGRRDELSWLSLSQQVPQKGRPGNVPFSPDGGVAASDVDMSDRLQSDRPCVNSTSAKYPPCFLQAGGQLVDFVQRVVEVETGATGRVEPNRLCSGIAQWCPARMAMP